MPKKKKEILPWEEEHLRADIKKQFPLRLPEPDLIKLQYISEKTGKPMHRFCVEVLLPAIDDEIDRLVDGK